jgi:hypothetical protein
MTKKKTNKTPYEMGYDTFLLGGEAECPISIKDTKTYNISDYRSEWYRGYYDARIQTKLKHVFDKYRIVWSV